MASKENFIKLINQYQNLVFSICLKLTGDYFVAEDLAQETFVSAFQHWEEFDGQAEKAWICRIASNKCIDYCRTMARRKTSVLEEDVLEGSMISEEDPLQYFLNQEIIEELKVCCQSLASPYREMAWKHFVEGKTAKEIAKESGIGIHTVQTQIYRAKNMLKKSFRKEMLKK